MIEKIFFVIFLFWLPFQLGLHFWPKEAFLFGLKIDFLSPTFYFQDLLIIFLILRKIVLTKIPDKKCLIIGLLYLALASLNIFFSATPLLSLFSWLRITEMVALGLIVSGQADLIYSLLLRILPISLIFEFVLGLSQVVRQSATGAFWLFGERSFNIFTPGIAKAVFLNKVFLRPYGTFSHPNSLAGFILVAVILLLSKKNLRFLDKIAIILGLVLIILSFSRTVWLASFILGIIYLFFKLKEGLRLKKLSLNYSYLLLSVFIPLIFFFYSKSTFDSSSYTLRRDLGAVSLSLIKQSPLLGVGAGQFIVRLSREEVIWPSLYWLQPVHNIYLLIFSEVGILGLLSFLVLIIVVGKRLLSCYLVSLLQKNECKITIYQANKIAQPCLFLFSALLTILFTGLFDHYWLTLIQNQLLFALVLGLSFGSSGVKMKR